MTEANIRVARRKLSDRINQIRAERAQQELLRKSDGTGCDHEWKTYKQRIEIDHSVEVINDKPRDYTGPIAPYFIVKGCEKCKTKHYIDMKSM